METYKFFHKKYLIQLYFIQETAQIHNINSLTLLLIISTKQISKQKYFLDKSKFINHLMRKNNYSKRQPQQQTKNCNYGFTCSNLIEKGRCNYHHQHKHWKQAQTYKKIKQRGTTIVTIKSNPYILPKQLNYYVQTNVDMPIGIIGFDHTLQNFYYQAKFIECKNNRIILQKIKDLGKIGQIKLESRLIKNNFPQIFKLQQKKGQTKKGRIRVNPAGVKCLRGQDNFRRNFQKVNQKSDYPLLNQALIQYTFGGRNQNSVFIHSIKYEQNGLSGILQIDNDGVLQFIPRDQTIDFMTPLSIPSQFIQDLKLKQLQNFSIIWSFKDLKQNRKFLKTINMQLSKYIVRGYFNGWPLSSESPLIQLENRIDQRNLFNIKQAIIFEKGLSGKKFDKKQIKQAEKIVTTYKKNKSDKGNNKNKYKSKTKQIQFEKQQYEKQQSSLFKFTIDSTGTKSRDDAISISEDKQEDAYQIGIHISDVSYYIKKNSYLDQQAKKRDQTLYVKNYYFPMLPDILTKDFLSLKANQQKMTYSLFFKMNKKGLIKLNTCKVGQTISKIDRNLTHKEADIILQKELNKQNKNQKDLVIGKNLQMLHQILKNRKLIDQNESLQTGFESQKIISQLMNISSYLVGYILQKNIEKISNYKEKVTQFIEKQVKQNFNQLNTIQKDVKTLQQVRKKIIDVENSKNKLKNKYDKKIQTQTKKIKNQYKNLKKQQDLVKKKQKSEKIKTQSLIKLKRNKVSRQRGGQELESQTDYTQQTQSEVEKQKTIIEEQISQTKQIQENFQEILKEAKQEQQKQKKQPIKQKKKPVQSQKSSTQSQQQIDQQTENKLKQANAQFGRQYLQRVFNHFNIPITWLSTKQIQGAFLKIIKMNKNKSKLYEQYFERMQIMNQQHYKHIVKSQKAKNKEKNIKNTNHRSNIEDQLANQKKNKSSNIKNKYMEKNQQKIHNADKQIQKKINIIVQAKQQSKQKQKQYDNNKNKNKQKTKKVEKRQKNGKKKTNNGKYQQKKQCKTNLSPLKDEFHLLMKKYMRISHKEKNQEFLSPHQCYETKIQQKNNNLVQQISQIKEEQNIMSPKEIQQNEKTIRRSQKIQNESINKDLLKKKQINKQQISIMENSSDQMNKLIKKYFVYRTPQQIALIKKQREKSLKQQEKIAIASMKKELLTQFDQEAKQFIEKIKNYEESIKQIKQKLVHFVDNWRILKKTLQSIKEKEDYSKVQKNFLKIIDNISSKIKYKPKKTEQKDVKQKLQSIHYLKTFEQQKIKQDNEQLFQFASNQNNQLKWNNPIRSHSSLQTLRIIKEFEWIFQGQLHPLDVLQFADQIKDVKKAIKNLKKNKKTRQQVGQLDRSVKDANRQIAKWQFYESIKNNLEKQITFLNVLPPPTRHIIKKVYHPILQELQVQNVKFEQKDFEQVKGKVIVRSQFPLIFSVELLK